MAKRFRVLLEKAVGMDSASITVPFDVVKVFGSRARVPVRGTINGFPYRSSIFPMDGRHLLIVNKAMREGAQVKGGEVVSVVMERDDEPRVITPPRDFARAIKASKEAQAFWKTLSYTHQKEHVRAIEEAKRPETRARRIEKAIEMLTAGKKPQ